MLSTMEGVWARQARPRNVFLLLLVLSLGIRITGSLVIGLRHDASFLDMGDEREYYGQASALAHGQYSPDLRRPIGYVSLLALFQLITLDNFTAIQLINAAVFGLAAPLMYLLVQRMVGNNLVAAITGVFTILWPPFLYYGRTLYSETATLPLFILFLLSIPRGSVVTDRARGGWLPYILSGILLGICALFRPMYLLFCPFAILILVFEVRSWQKAIARAAATVLGFILTISPWSILLSIKSGAPVLLSTTGGEALAAGLNPVVIQRGYEFLKTPDGRLDWMGPGKAMSSFWDAGYLNEEEMRLPDSQRDKLLRQRVFAWVIQNPGQALWLERAKLLYMWGMYPFITTQQVWLNLMSLSVVTLSLLSVVRFRGYSRRLVRFWILPFFVSATAMISSGMWRYKQPADLGLLALTALFLVSLWIPPSKVMKSAEG